QPRLPDFRRRGRGRDARAGAAAAPRDRGGAARRRGGAAAPRGAARAQAAGARIRVTSPVGEFPESDDDLRSLSRVTWVRWDGAAALRPRHNVCPHAIYVSRFSRSTLRTDIVPGP